MDMLACPQCGKREGQIVNESLGSYTRCHACGLTLARHYHHEDIDKQDKLAVEAWNNLASRIIPPDDRLAP